MKRFLSLIFVAFISICSAFAQADKIVGTYKVFRNGVNSKVKVFKHENGYRAQVIWADNLIKADGSTLTDEKNPDKSKRNVPANKIVLIENITYNAKDNCWDNGKIYDPTKGKTYKVTINFKDDKTLKLRGYIGVPTLGESMYWTKID